MSDPYNPFEGEMQLTRHALELIDAFGFGAAIATKKMCIRDRCKAVRGAEGAGAGADPSCRVAAGAPFLENAEFSGDL